MSKTLNELQLETGTWADATFPSSTPLTILSHFEEEANELLETWLALPGEPHTFPPSISDVAEEAADCLLLLLHLAHKTGFSLFDAAEHKLAVNRQRKWKAEPEAAGHIKHVEGT